MLNDEQIAAYREMAKNAGENSMEAQIRANLEATCDKFAGNEDKFDRCMAFLVKCANEILEGENGDIPDEVCFRICRDYFNDEIWKADDDEDARKKAEDEERAKAKAEKESKKNKKTEKAQAKTTKPAPEHVATENEKPVAAVPETTTAEAIVKKIAEKNRRLVDETLDLFSSTFSERENSHD